MPMAAEGRAVGVMLPNANGAVVTVLGLMTAGRVPAMINFTAGAANILAACKAAQVDTILTSTRLHREGQARQPGRRDRD
jgi:acyl-[acyl-carrier-protein]-phospholipid O-acyltransferase/long-chain-fatty-acid--[acyl-carrier-protein] ligase